MEIKLLFHPTGKLFYLKMAPITVVPRLSVFIIAMAMMVMSMLKVVQDYRYLFFSSQNLNFHFSYI